MDVRAAKSNCTLFVWKMKHQNLEQFNSMYTKAGLLSLITIHIILLILSEKKTYIDTNCPPSFWQDWWRVYFTIPFPIRNLQEDLEGSVWNANNLQLGPFLTIITSKAEALPSRSRYWHHCFSSTLTVRHYNCNCSGTLFSDNFKNFITSTLLFYGFVLCL